jgi:hypothetical protein
LKISSEAVLVLEASGLLLGEKARYWVTAKIKPPAFKTRW